MIAKSLTSLLLLASNAWAIDLPVMKATNDLNNFLAQSKANPNKLYILKASAEWCGPCKSESKELAKVTKKTHSNIAASGWLEVDVDHFAKEYEEVFTKNGLPKDDGIPLHLIFKNGQPIGSKVGNDLADLEKFLDEANGLEGANTNPNTNPQLTQVNKFNCESSQQDDICVIGISGYRKASNDPSDGFGQMNLQAFAKLFKNPKFSALMAPPVQNYTLTNSKNSEGKFFIKNPFLTSNTKLSNNAEYPATIEKIASLPGKNIQLLMTGHGSRDGITYDYENAGSIGYTYKESKDFNQTHFKQAISNATNANKSVRLISTQCFGGQFAEPLLDHNKNPDQTCGAFATLPEKSAEGCYESFSAQRFDYLYYAEKNKVCDGKQNGIDLHYKIVSESQGHDVPFLSSEYFLLFGDGAKFLSTNQFLDPMLRNSTVLRREMASGVVIYFDRLNQKIIKTLYKGQKISNPSLTLVDCLADGYSYYRLEASRLSYSYLKKRTSGVNNEEVGDCAAEYKLDYASSDQKKYQLPLTEKFNSISNFKEPYHKAEVCISCVQCSMRYPKELQVDECKVSLNDLKPEAKMLFSVTRSKLDFLDSYNETETSTKFTAFQKEISKINPTLNQTISELLVRYKNIFNAKNKPVAYNQIFNQLFLNLTDGNLGQGYNLADDQAHIIASRLAHLMAVGAAELELRSQASKNPKANAVLKKYQALQECEKKLF